jgi:hypothetical protein
VQTYRVHHFSAEADRIRRRILRHCVVVSLAKMYRLTRLWNQLFVVRDSLRRVLTKLQAEARSHSLEVDHSRHIDLEAAPRILVDNHRRTLEVVRSPGCIPEVAVGTPVLVEHTVAARSCG